MKRILFSLLTCSICLSAFTQIDTSKKISPGNSEKWEIIKGNAKSSTGKLFVTLPKGTEWDMTVYAAGTTKVLSNTSLKTSLTLPPGTYDVQVNHIWVRGVPVEKGNNTRLKAGVLHMTTTDSWTLYDEPKKIVLINSLSPQERGLPIGKYKLTILGQVQDIEIIDEPPVKEQPQIIETDRWVNTKMSNPPAENKGRLSTRFYGTWTVGVVWAYSSTSASSDLNPPDFLDLDTGICSVVVNGVSIKDVPIMAGYITRVKGAYLVNNTIAVGSFWQLCDTSKQIIYTVYSYHTDVPSMKTVFVPAGSFNVFVFYRNTPQTFADAYYPIVIKDNVGGGEITQFINQRIPNETGYWVMSPMLKTSLTKLKTGSLNINFPKDDWDIKIYQKYKKNPIAIYHNNPEIKPKSNFSSPSTYPNFLPGKYDISISNVMTENIWIQTGQETRLKAGILHIISEGEWSLSKRGDLITFPNGSWDVYNINGNQLPFAFGSQPKKIILPAGAYKLKLNGIDNSLIISDGRTSQF